MDKYRRLQQTIEIGAGPPDSASLNDLFEDLMGYWHISWRQRMKMRRADYG